jgi:hypothetical protein
MVNLKEWENAVVACIRILLLEIVVSKTTELCGLSVKLVQTFADRGVP